MATTTYEGKMKLNSMKAGMGPPMRKLKEGYNKVNAETFRIDVNRKNQEKQEKQDVSRNIKQVEMPLFPMKMADPYNIKNLKLE